MGIAPLFAPPAHDDSISLMLIGCVDVSDYLDIIVARGYEDQVYAALLDTLTRPDFPVWHSLDLCTIPAASPTNTILKAIAQARGFTVEYYRHDVSPIIF